MNQGMVTCALSGRDESRRCRNTRDCTECDTAFDTWTTDDCDHCFNLRRQGHKKTCPIREFDATKRKAGRR